MESFRGPGFGMAANVATRRRSNTARKPRMDPHLFMEGHDTSTPPSTPSSENVSKQSTESGSFDSGNQKKIFSLNTTNLKTSSINKLGGVTAPGKVRKDEKFGGPSDRVCGNGSSRSGSGSSDRGRNRGDLKRCSEGMVATSRTKTGDFEENQEFLMASPDNCSSYGGGEGRTSSTAGKALNGSAENKLRKVKLKVGGVTHTLHAKSSTEGGASAASTKPPRSSDSSRHRHKLNLQEISDNDHSGSHGSSWKGSGRGNNNSHLPKEASHGKFADETLPGKQTETVEPVRKSKRIPKKRVLDGAFDEEDEDDEIRYLERLRISKLGADYFAEQEGNVGDTITNKKSYKSLKNRRPSYEEDLDFALSRRSKDGRKKSRSEMESEEMNYVEEEEQVSDAGHENKRRKQESVDSPDTADEKKFTLTTRQRALQSSKDGSGGNGSSLIEFPNGLPPAPPRKQKGKPSEVEQQLKKAEAAQRRRMQVEKAARESEAEAIRKILGQDSSRKKREEKLRKKREELAQGRASNLALASDYVRWVIGPNGTTVTFPEGADLPSIFNSPPCRYPPPREKCAGPSCTNTYKYRDAKSNLPLCSLQCYRAVQQNMQQLATC